MKQNISGYKEFTQYHAVICNSRKKEPMSLWALFYECIRQTHVHLYLYLSDSKSSVLKMDLMDLAAFINIYKKLKNK